MTGNYQKMEVFIRDIMTGEFDTASHGYLKERACLLLKDIGSLPAGEGCNMGDVY